MAKAKKKPKQENKPDNVYTYVGGGTESPAMISYMGLQDFMLGDATEVTNEMVLSKIQHNQCFVKGEVDKKEIIAAQKDAKAKVAEQSELNNKIQEAEVRRNG